MPENIEAGKKRRHSAILSAAISAFWQLLAAGVFFWIREAQPIPIWLWWVLTICAVLDILMLIPLGISLKQRLHEIDGGEEDEAGNY